MIRITILYPATPGARFDADYYVTRHIPLALQLLGKAVTAVSVDLGSSPGPPWPAPTFAAICTFTCETLEAYQQALFPHAAQLQADLANYSDAAPLVQISQVALDQALTPS